MKKLIYLFLTLTFVFAFSLNMYAKDLGELISIHDKVIPNGENAIITQTIKAKTSIDGEVVFPAYKDSEIVAFDVTTGTIDVESNMVELGDKAYNSVVFKEKETEVTFVVTMNQEGIYRVEEADLGDTFPGNANEVVYKAVNTSPLDIGKYSAQLAAPQGEELLNIIDYKSKKPFSMFEEDGYTFGQYNFKGIDSGEEAELAINIYSRSNIAVVFVWITGIMLSIIFMMRNKHLLVKAKEGQSKKKEAANA